jgi:hypothetical protein
MDQKRDSSAAGALQWDAAGEMPEAFTTRLRAQLEVLVLAHEGAEYLVRLALHDPRLTVEVAGKTNAPPSGSTPASGLARIADDGRIRGYLFADDVPSATRSMLVALFAATHQFILRDDAEPWTISGLSDELGTFSARFDSRRTAAGAGSERLHREILAYAPRSNQRVIASSASARFDDGWIGAADARETRRLTVGDVMSAETSFRLDVELEERALAAVDPELVARASAHFSLDPAEGLKEASEQEEDAGAQQVSAEEARAAFGELRSRIESLAAEGQLGTYAGFEAWRDLADLIRRAAGEVVPEVLALMRAGEISVDAASWLASALGKAGADGSAAAVDALAGLIADATLAEDLRLVSLFAAHQVGANVSSQIVAATTDILLDARLGSGSPLPDAAMLLLGTLAGESGMPPAQLELLGAGLEAVREQAFARSEPQLYFEALVNSGRIDLIDLTYDYLDNPDERTRSAATEILGRLDGDPRAAEALARAIALDEVARVRAAAAEALGSLTPSPETARLLLAAATNDADAEVRSQAVSALGGHALQGSGEARAALEGLVASGDPAVQEQVRGLLEELRDEA